MTSTTEHIEPANSSARPSSASLEAVKIDVKVMALASPGDHQQVSPEELIPVFHRWIRDGLLEDLLVDVADYSHVPNGPGVLLIGHDAHYGLDQSGGRLGLLYSRRRETHPSLAGLGSDSHRLASAIEVALGVCSLLEGDESLAGRLRFGQELEVKINDRLVSTNDEAGEARWLPVLREVLAERGKRPRYRGNL